MTLEEIRRSTRRMREGAAVAARQRDWRENHRYCQMHDALVLEIWRRKNA